MTEQELTTIALNIPNAILDYTNTYVNIAVIYLNNVINFNITQEPTGDIQQVSLNSYGCIINEDDLTVDLINQKINTM